MGLIISFRAQTTMSRSTLLNQDYVCIWLDVIEPRKRKNPFYIRISCTNFECIVVTCDRPKYWSGSEDANLKGEIKRLERGRRVTRRLANFLLENLLCNLASCSSHFIFYKSIFSKLILLSFLSRLVFRWFTIQNVTCSNILCASQSLVH